MEDLRKLAAEIVGKAALEEWFGTPTLSALDQVTLHKLASADQELLKVAASFGSENILKVYEELGGQYKDAGIGGSLAQGAGKLLGQAAMHPGAVTASGHPAQRVGLAARDMPCWAGPAAWRAWARCTGSADCYSTSTSRCASSDRR